MPADRLRPIFPLLCAALVLGLSGCKQSADATAPAQEATASTADKVAAVADAVNPLASPREEVIAAMRKLMDARSYRAEMQHSGGPRGAMTNTVEFVARFKVGGRAERLHEISNFVREPAEGGPRWFYVDGSFPE